MQRAAWLLLVLGVACQAPAPVADAPLLAVAVWPGLGEFDRLGDLLLPPLEQALRERHCRVVPANVARELLADVGAAAPQDAPAAVARALAVPTVLQLVVREFTASGARPLREARWDFEWRLVSLPSGAVTWSHSERGSWTPPRADFGDPHRRLDAEPQVVPIGGDGEFLYRDARELVLARHLLATKLLVQRAP